MNRARAKPAPPGLPFAMIQPRPAGPAWHKGRTFYSCGRCSSQEELTAAHRNPPAVLNCWNCGNLGGMHQWTPPAIRAG